MNKYTYNLDIFRIDSEISFYLLGAFMTDGCVKIYPKRKLVTLVSKDKDWLEIIRDIIAPNLPIAPVNGSNCFILNLTCTELANILISKGCTNAKSFTLKFPDVPEKYLPDFVRGCIDGDGCIGQYKYVVSKNNKTYLHNVCYLCSSSEGFIKSFYENFKSKETDCFLAIQSDANKIIKYTQPHYRVTFSNSNAKRFLEKIYYPGHIISMPRKRLLAEKIISI
jgi:hypothetical protein